MLRSATARILWLLQSRRFKSEIKGTKMICTVSPFLQATVLTFLEILLQDLQKSFWMSGASKILSGIEGMYLVFRTEASILLWLLWIFILFSQPEKKRWSWWTLKMFNCIQNILAKHGVCSPPGGFCGLPPKCKIFALLMLNPFRFMDQAFCFSYDNNSENNISQ